MDLKRLIPAAVRARLKTSALLVRHRSRFVNVFHCAVYRTASQWMRRLLSDRRVCRYSGLLYEMRFERVFGTAAHPDRTVAPAFPFSQPFPPKRIVGLYASYEGYARIPGPENHRAFFVLRDPRDIVVSHYFGSRRTDMRANGRSRRSVPPEPAAGLLWMMETLEEMGLFTAMRSWVTRAAADPRVLIMRFEDLVGPRQTEAFEELFAFCDIAVPGNVLLRLLDEHAFVVMSGGRRPGEEDTGSHYRKGVAGDWRSRFTAAHVERFKALTGDLVDVAGYGW